MKTKEERLAICKACPLWEETILGPVCSRKRYINKEQKISWFPRSGYIRGCGCHLNSKTSNPENHCIIDLW